MKWDYGDAGDRYPVRYGDVWRVGEHVLICGDLTRGLGPKLFAWAPKPPAMFYSDPPWDAGNARAFRTKAAGYQSEPVDFQELIRAVLEVAASAPCTYIEMGSKHVADTEQWMTEAGIRPLHRWPITYYHKHPCWLIMGAKMHSNPVVLPGSPVGLDDEETPAWAIQSSTRAGDVVMDSCLGQGTTAYACASLGRICVGGELHPRRLACAIDLLVESFDLKAERIGSI